jgi:hypothetical protein
VITEHVLIYRFNEEMIESLFGYNSTDKKDDAKKDVSS